jgi:phosphoglycolate phosphatase
MAIKLVTFDVDGTLMRRHPNVNTLKVDAIDHAVRKVFGLKSFNYLDHLRPNMYGMTDRSIMRLLLKNLGAPDDKVDGQVDDMLTEALVYFDSHPGHSVHEDYYLLPGVEAMLQELKAAGVEMGLATGNYSRFAHWKVDGLGLGKYFTFGGFGEDAEERADIIKAALKRAGAGRHPSRDNNGRLACHFGDTPVDILSAKANGIYGGAICETFEARDLHEAGADLVIDSWHDITGVMAFLNRE